MGARMTMFEKTPPKPRNASVSAQEVGSIESSPSAILTPRSYFEDEEINYRSCTWAKTAMLMFATYIGPAVMTFPSAMSEMGIFAGVLLTLVNAGFYSYTSMVLWRFCVKNKDMKDISDIARKVAGRIGYVITSVMFVWHCIVSFCLAWSLWHNAPFLLRLLISRIVYHGPSSCDRFRIPQHCDQKWYNPLRNYGICSPSWCIMLGTVLHPHYEHALKSRSVSQFSRFCCSSVGPILPGLSGWADLEGQRKP